VLECAPMCSIGQVFESVREVIDNWEGDAAWANTVLCLWCSVWCLHLGLVGGLARQFVPNTGKKIPYSRSSLHKRDSDAAQCSGSASAQPASLLPAQLALLFMVSCCSFFPILLFRFLSFRFLSLPFS
jgi:hypothetical protein